MRARRRAVWALSGLLSLVALASVGTGAVEISPAQVAAAALGALGLPSPWPHDPTHALVLWSLRLPRAALGGVVGASLAASGAALQGVFRNPLADPGLIGVSSGGALGAALVIVMGLGVFAGGAALPLAAFLGGLAATFVVYQLATRRGRTSVGAMLLAGVAVNALAGACLGLLTYLSDDAALRSLSVWSLGSLGGASWGVVVAVAPAGLLAVVLLTRRAAGLNALLLGEAEAEHLGVEVGALKRAVVALAALAVGAGVGFTGMIGFVGLVAPHLVRLALGPDHRALLPCSALLGACLLLGADLACRTLAAPAELPLGVVTALVGAPFFLALMSRQREQEAL